MTSQGSTWPGTANSRASGPICSCGWVAYRCSPPPGTLGWLNSHAPSRKSCQLYRRRGRPRPSTRPSTRSALSSPAALTTTALRPSTALARPSVRPVGSTGPGPCLPSRSRSMSRSAALPGSRRPSSSAPAVTGARAGALPRVDLDVPRRMRRNRASIDSILSSAITGWCVHPELARRSGGAAGWHRGSRLTPRWRGTTGCRRSRRPGSRRRTGLGCGW